MAQVETNEGVTSGEDNEVIQWLKDNRLLKAKDKFIENEVSLDDLKAIDLKLELNDFIKDDLQLSGIWATKARKAIIALQQTSAVASPAQPIQAIRTIVLSKEEDEAMTTINVKCEETKKYMKKLNNDINILTNTDKENKNKINAFEQELMKEIKNRMNQLRNQSDKQINTKKQQISAHLNKIKAYNSSLTNANNDQQKILNDRNIDRLKRKIKITEIAKNVDSKIMDNKPKFNPMVSIDFNKSKTLKFVRSIGSINSHNYPDPPTFSINKITAFSATIQFQKTKRLVECTVEICEYEGKESDDEKNTDWKQLAVFKNKNTFLCKPLKNNKQYKLRAKYKNEYGFSSYSQVKTFKTSKGTRYHPGSIQPYHPRELQSLKSGHSAGTYRAHAGSLPGGRFGTYTCCGGNNRSPGCIEKYACCSEVKRQGGSGGCQWITKYPCCNNLQDHNGCSKKYTCCDKITNSKGCQIKDS